MTGYGWLAKLVTVAILAGFSSVILVMLLGQTRVFYAMSKDGLVPKVFSDVHPRYQTPYKSQALFFVFTALFAAFIPESVVGEMTSIGTLFAFVLVCWRCGSCASGGRTSRADSWYPRCRSSRRSASWCAAR
jgi:APA family basic amino acid/polyamine antiporter